jgi:hypothetical protein
VGIPGVSLHLLVHPLCFASGKFTEIYPSGGKRDFTGKFKITNLQNLQNLPTALLGLYVQV